MIRSLEEVASRVWLKHFEEIISVFKYLVCIWGVGSVCPFSSEKSPGNEAILTFKHCLVQKWKITRQQVFFPDECWDRDGPVQCIQREFHPLTRIFLLPQSDHFWLYISLTSNSSLNKTKAWGQCSNANSGLPSAIPFPFVNRVNFLSLLSASSHLFHWSLVMGD